MLLRRVIDHVKAQNWTAVALDFVIVVMGVFIGIQVANWNEARAEKRRTDLIIAVLRQDLEDSRKVEQEFFAEVDAGLAAFQSARARGERPPPYFYRIEGSDKPPALVWQAAMQSRLADLVHPSLLFDLGFFYSEREGIGEKFVRYSVFVENEILPRLNADPSAFYDERGELKPEFAANMERLREWRSFLEAIFIASKCLDERFMAPTQPGPSCRPEFSPEEAP